MKIIIANWKANPPTLAEAQELFRAEAASAEKYGNVQTIICPPFVFLEELAKERQATSDKRQATSLGTQDVFWEESEILEPQELGISHVLVGHSDRRYKINLPSTTLGQPKVVLGETDEIINKKIKVALGAGIIPVLLVGEKNRGDDRKTILGKQLLADLEGLDSDQISKVLIAYEPVWAISTTPGAEPDTPENTLEAIKIIDNFITGNWKLETRNYLYGGSVTEKNVADFLFHPEISGAVIGGASLKKEEFANILKIVSEL